MVLVAHLKHWSRFTLLERLPLCFQFFNFKGTHRLRSFEIKVRLEEITFPKYGTELKLEPNSVLAKCLTYWIDTVLWESCVISFMVPLLSFTSWWISPAYLERSNFCEFRKFWAISWKLIPEKSLAKTNKQKSIPAKNTKLPNFQKIFKFITKKIQRTIYLNSYWRKLILTKCFDEANLQQ